VLALPVLEPTQMVQDKDPRHLFIGGIVVNL